MSASIPAYDEIAAALAGLDPQKVMDLRPSESLQNRLRELLAKNQEGALSADEKHELDKILALDLLLSLTKTYARRLLAKTTQPKNGQPDRLKKAQQFKGDAPFPNISLTKYDVYGQ